MKKFLFMLLIFTTIITCPVYAAGEKATIHKVSENLIDITIKSSEKIKITGYDITNGSDIVVDFIKDKTRSNIASIKKLDLSTVIRPYKVIINNADNAYNYQPFNDIKDSEMKNYIRHLYDSGFINGYEEDNTFRPNNNITRAEFITLIVRMMELNERPLSSKMQFEDLKKTHWAYSEVIKAVSNGIIDGYDENNKKLLKLDNNITIAEVSKIIDSALKINSKSTANSDARFLKHWAKSNIQSLLNSDVISQTDDFYKKGEIDRLAKRGEVAMLLSRTLGGESSKFLNEKFSK